MHLLGKERPNSLARKASALIGNCSLKSNRLVINCLNVHLRAFYRNLTPLNVSTLAVVTLEE